MMDGDLAFILGWNDAADIASGSGAPWNEVQGPSPYYQLPLEEKSSFPWLAILVGLGAIVLLRK